MGAGKATVLVVEDETLVLGLIGETLKYEGYNVLDATNAHQALALADCELGISVLLTDINMPAMSGLELAEHMAAKHPDVSLIVMSGRQYLDDGDLPDDGTFLRKPFTSAQLLKAVNSLRHPLISEMT